MVRLGRVVPSLEARARHFGVTVKIETQVADVGNVCLRAVLHLGYSSGHAHVDFEVLVDHASRSWITRASSVGPMSRWSNPW